MKTIILLGELGKRYGSRHRMDVKTPAEAIRALCANFKDFAAFMSSSQERNVGYRVLDMREDVAAKDLHTPAGSQIAIVPVVAGGGGGMGQILLGAALIAFAVIAPPLAATVLFGTTTLGTVAFGIGVSLALGGVAQLLAPTPKQPDNTTEKNSYVFNGAVNTQAQGQPVPIGYGRMIVGSAVISAGIRVEDVTT